MIDEAIEVELAFCDDALALGISGISPAMMKEYLRYCADQRFVQLGYNKRYMARNPFPFMVLQDVQPLTNFFEKRVTEYQKGFSTTAQAVVFDEAF
jgi:ribonucleoside-diphosphate reductase beta chain